jgi:hypothetical protein
VCRYTPRVRRYYCENTSTKIRCAGAQKGQRQKLEILGPKKSAKPQAREGPPERVKA